MRLAIFSDIHANIEALKAVIEQYDDHAVDLYCCLGDIVGYGGSPNECIDLVRDVADFTILGNHDAAVAGRMDYSYYYEAAKDALDKHAQQLTEINMGFLKSLPYSHLLSGAGVNLCHGSPVRLEEFDYIFSPEQAAECLPIWEELAPLTVIGHSHLCKVFALTPTRAVELPATDFTMQKDKKYIVSVGSVGQPRDYDNRASYTLFDSETERFSFRRVKYDIEGAASKIFEARIDQNFAQRLFLGV